MNRRLYVVERYSRRRKSWEPHFTRESRRFSAANYTVLAMANKYARELFERMLCTHSVRVVPYGPHGERVSSRPLLVLRAKGGRR